MENEKKSSLKTAAQEEIVAGAGAAGGAEGGSTLDAAQKGRQCKWRHSATTLIWVWGTELGRLPPLPPLGTQKLSI